MKTRQGRKNIKPTEGEVAGYYSLLRSAASEGDVNAAANLISIYEQQRARRRMEHDQ